MEEKMIDYLSFSTNISKDLIMKMSDSANSHDYFKRCFITKKNGGRRAIYMPISELKTLQHFIVEEYFSKIEIHDCAFAYRKKLSIRDVAEKHLFNKHFLYIDIKHFFESISYEIFKNIIFSKKYLNLKLSELELILNLCSRKHQFSQGCVSSPIISNIFMYDIDKYIDLIAKKLPNGVYTRYSDDLLISSSDIIDESILKDIENKLGEFKLKINKKKTKFVSNLQNINILGTKIINGKVSLSNSFKRNLNNELYHLLKMPILNKSKTKHVLGLLNYLKMIDIDYYTKLNYKYSDGEFLTIDRLKNNLNDKK